MEAAYHIDFCGCINLIAGWKEFVAESGIEDGDVVMVMFFRERRWLSDVQDLCFVGLNVANEADCEIYPRFDYVVVFLK